MKKKKEKNKKALIYGSIMFVILLLLVILVIYLLNNNTSITNVKVTNSGLHKILITWDNIEKVDEYKVILSKNSFNKEEISSNLEKNNTDDNLESYQTINNSITISDVLSNTEYYVCIIGYSVSKNNKNILAISDVIKFKTDSLEINKVENLEITDVSNSSIKLKWDAYQIDNTNLDGSKIEVSYEIYEKDKLIMSNIIDTECIIENLNEFTDYEYQVLAGTVIDGNLVKGKPSDILHIKTKSNPINGVKISETNTNSLKITWDKYEKNDVKDITYSIYGSNSSDGEYKLLSDQITDNYYIEEKLDSNKTRYYYVVASYYYNDVNYFSANSNIISGTTKTKTNTYVPSTSSNSSSNSNQGNTSSSGLTASQKEEQAREVARYIAKQITGNSDQEKIELAAQIVQYYYYMGVHSETGNDYYTAYGVFIKGESSCAGTTRALGMILEEMGYSWRHANENQWTHQWVIVDNMDGQVGWADGMIGMAGYGGFPFS